MFNLHAIMIFDESIKQSHYRDIKCKGYLKTLAEITSICIENVFQNLVKMLNIYRVFIFPHLLHDRVEFLNSDA